MADQLHNALSRFREDILTSVARLEFQLRDTISLQRQQLHDDAIHKLNEMHSTILKRMNEMQLNSDKDPRFSTPDNSSTISSIEAQESVQNVNIEENLLSFQPPQNTRNVIVPSVRSTPALFAAVTAANIPKFNLNIEGVDGSDNESSVVEGSVTDTDSSRNEGSVVEEENSGPALKKVVIDNITFYIDEENNVYSETEDGYEQVGTYNEKNHTVNYLAEEAVDDEEEEGEDEQEEEEEEGIEVEEFVYKGVTYQRDSEGNVYNEEGETVGKWNGKKIVRLA